MVNAMEPDGTFGGTEPITAPLQTDVTVAIGVLVSIALGVFIVFMLYLAFGPHGRQLNTDVTPAEQAESAAEDADPEDVETAKDESAGGTDAEREPEFETGAGAETGESSNASGGTESGSAERR